MDIPGGKNLATYVAKMVVAAYGSQFTRYERQRDYIAKLASQKIDTAGVRSCDSGKCRVVLASKDIKKCRVCTEFYCPSCLIEGQCPDCLIRCEFNNCISIVKRRKNDNSIIECECDTALCPDHVIYCRDCGTSLCSENPDCEKNHECDQGKKRRKK